MYKLLQHIGMSNYKLLASQAQLINRYKNTRSKLQKCSANIYFNKQCLVKQITPTYVNIRVSNTSPAALVTTRKAQTIRVKDEIKFLHKKKEKLNKEFNIHGTVHRSMTSSNNQRDGA